MISLPPETPVPARRSRRVAFTRGEQCAELASILGPGDASRITGDLRRFAIERRLDLLVAGRLSGFDLVPVVVPHGLDLDRVRGITAAVGAGPHTPLAAALAVDIGTALDIPVELVAVVAPGEPVPESLGESEDPGVSRRVIVAKSARSLVDALAPDHALVLGAPGGSWIYRQLLGAGRHLLHRAPAGAVIVRNAPRRCFHEMSGPDGRVVSPHLSAADALSVTEAPVVAVAHDGQLVGVAFRSQLADAAPSSDVGSVMVEPIALHETDPVTAAGELHLLLEGGPIPVVDDRGMLKGLLG